MGISGFEPSFLVGIDAVRHAHGPRLAKLDELSIGWNTIDTAAPLTGWEWFELTPQWTHDDERIRPFLGQVLYAASLLEWRPPGRDLAAGTVTVEFAFAGGRLRIANGLDENHIEVGPTPGVSRGAAGP